MSIRKYGYISMSITINKIKDQYAISRGFKDWEDQFNARFLNNYVTTDLMRLSAESMKDEIINWLMVNTTLEVEKIVELKHVKIK